jgi:hypothetical protein
MEDATMAETGTGAQGKGEQPKEPFVSREDRPAVRISLDTPLGELRVRELSAILNFMANKNANFEVGKTPLKDFFDKDFPEVAKDWVKEIKIEKIEKPEKPEKLEKNEKFEKNEKLEKHEKFEKPEKFEKLESGEGVVNPGPIPGPDPRIEQIIQAVSGLAKQVAQLANQVEELRKKASG